MKIFIGSFIGFLLLAPVVGFAAPQDSANDGGPQDSFNNNTVKLQNPLGEGNSTFAILIKKLLDAAFIIGLPVAVLFIVLAGFRFIWARGNQTQLTNAKNNLLYTVIGIAVFFGAWLLASVIANTICSIGNSANASTDFCK